MRHEARKRVRLGDLLLEKKLISEQQLKEALAEQRSSGRKLGRVLIDIGAISEADLHATLAAALNIPYVDLAHIALDPKIVSCLPEAQARRHRALVLKEDARGYLVGMADPTDLFAFDELARLLGKPIRLALAKEAALLRTIDLVYRRTEEIFSLAEELERGAVTGRRRSRGIEGRGGVAGCAGHQADSVDVPGRRPGRGLGHPHRARRALPAGSARVSTACCKSRSSRAIAWGRRWSRV